MIRHIEIDDIPKLAKLTRGFAEEIGFGDYFDYKTAAHLYHSMDLCLVGEKNGELVGVVGGHIGKSPWNSHVKIFQEEIYYVAPDHRNTLTGAKLLKKFMKEIELLDVNMSTMKLMFNSPDIAAHYEANGYQKLETTYVRK